MPKDMPPEANPCTLHAIRPGVFVYREEDAKFPGTARYLCRPCYEAGVAVALDRSESTARIEHVCPRCKEVFLEEIKPMSGRAISPW